LNRDRGYWALKLPSNGRRFFFASNNTVVEIFLSNEGLIRGESINLEYAIPSVSDFVVLNESKMLAVYYFNSKYSILQKLLIYPAVFIQKLLIILLGIHDFLFP
jgi:hypothetical protein